MSRRTLGWVVPLGYVLLIVAAAVFFPVAVAGLAIIGAVAVTVYYSGIRQAQRRAEQRREEARNDPRRGPDGPTWTP